MRSLKEVAVVQRLVEVGLNDCEISRQTGVPRSTVRHWRTGSRQRAMPGTEACAVCGHAAHDPDALPDWEYAYLLGLYLGDGCILRHPRNVYRLSIALDLRYPGIIASCVKAVESVINRPPGITMNPGWVDVNSYSKQWPCLFPQHGPGAKHKRPIVLADWQQAIVDEQPGALARGLIHSDGWRGMNRVTVKGKTYAYPRYQFCNRSNDIKRIFCEACDALGVEWRRMNAFNISVAKRASVARLDEFVGPKR